MMQELKLEIIGGIPTVNILVEKAVVGSVRIVDDEVELKIERRHLEYVGLNSLVSDSLELIDAHNSTPNTVENNTVDFDYDFITDNLTWLEDSGNCSRYLDETTNDCDWVCNRCEEVLEEDPLEHVCE